MGATTLLAGSITLLAPPSSAQVSVTLPTALEEVGQNDRRISFAGGDGDPSVDAEHPAIAYNPDRNEFLVLWQQDRGTFEDLFGQRLAGATGARRGGAFRINTNRNAVVGQPAVVYNPDAEEYLAIWSDFDALRVRRIGGDGSLLGTERRISGVPGSEFETILFPSGVYNPREREYFVVWMNFWVGNQVPCPEGIRWEIYGQRLTPQAGELGPDLQVSQMGCAPTRLGIGVFPDVAFNPARNEYLVVWTGTSQQDDGPTIPIDVFGQRLRGSNGSPIGTNDFRIATALRIPAEQLDPDITPDYDDGLSVAHDPVRDRYLVTWSGDRRRDGKNEIFGQRLDGAGTEIGATSFRISRMGPNNDADFDAFRQDSLFDPEKGQFLVLWQGEDDRGGLVNGEFEIYLQRVASADGALGPEPAPRLSSMGTDGDRFFDAFNPAIARNTATGEAMVVWEGDDDRAQLVDEEFEIFGQRLGEPAPPPPQGGCVQDGNTLCLSDDRFSVEVDWRDSTGASGSGTPVRLTPDTGYFWFYDAANVEMVIKVLDTCGFANRFWVFAGGLTNVEVDITVTDTENGAVSTYRNPLGRPFQPIQDTEAFATCPVSASRSGGTVANPAAEARRQIDAILGAAGAASGPVATSRGSRAGAPPSVRKRGVTGSPMGSTYEIQTVLGANVDADPATELFHLNNVGPQNVVLFDDVREELEPYGLGLNTTPRADEEITDLGQGRFRVLVRVDSAQNGDLFPGGFVSPQEQEPLTDAALLIGIGDGTDPMDWQPSHVIDSAEIRLFAGGQRIATIPLPTSFFDAPAPWDGRLGVVLPGRAGQGIHDLVLIFEGTQEQSGGGDPPDGPCQPSSTALCLSDDRFRVEVDWRDATGATGKGTPVELTPDTGYFWFFNEENVEMVLKVLDTCAFANRFWVFAGGLTNVEVDITVTDTQTGAVSTYRNPQGRPFQPIQDTEAFATCP